MRLSLIGSKVYYYIKGNLALISDVVRFPLYIQTVNAYPNTNINDIKVSTMAAAPTPSPPTSFPTPFPTPYPTPFPTPYPTPFPTTYPTPPSTISYTYKGAGRCVQMAGDLPTTAAWSDAVEQEAKAWCSANDACFGFMTNPAWNNGKVQFCSAVTYSANSHPWVYYIRERDMIYTHLPFGLYRLASVI
jgi:hypothetical protein